MNPILQIIITMRPDGGIGMETPSDLPPAMALGMLDLAREAILHRLIPRPVLMSAADVSRDGGN